ncbi:MAG TPA: class I tRNA ligase family protein, partial [Thermoplasmata archaeon]|nr:class I tRNA ligase family protein [Thermoplasmata archaeon]
GLTYADALGRYHRMRGRAVLFPTGTHATGLPAVTFAQKVLERDPTTVRQLEENGVPAEEWRKLEEPAYAARFLGRDYLRVFRELGLLIDESAYVTTIDDEYAAFIRWQFHRLDEAGALVQAPHYASVCPVCGPVSVDPSETDLSKGGNAEWIVYSTIPFRLDDDRILLAATLRPETVYGATNVWLPEQGRLAVWHLGPHRYLVSPTAARRLAEQHGGHVGTEVPVAELLGREVVTPITGARLPVLPSPLVDPSIGTGVVMSVPAHAPADWLAIDSLSEHDRRRIGAIPEIVVVDASALTGSERELRSGDGAPSERALRVTGARSLADRAALDEATQRLYRLELVRGRLRPDLLEGASVADARTRVAERLSEEGTSPTLREFSEPVVCRNGHEVVIRKVPDQWFIRYGDPVWKSRTRDLVARMSIVPEEYARELPGILDWFADRPCTRRGRWLGTPFPRDESWVIEPIADSTLYPAFFPIQRFVTTGQLPVSALTDAFFDHVILGRGPGEPSLSAALQAEIRSEFQYWYPLDVNVGGKEHKRVHFPVFLATHALLLPPELHPRGLFVHWWLTNPEGGKISKKEVASKGGAIPPMRDAFRRWGADALRLFYAQAASPVQDIVWDPALVEAAAQRLADAERLSGLVLAPGGGGPPELERWLESRAHEIVTSIRASFDGLQLRDAAESAFATFPSVLRRYLARGGSPGLTLQKVAGAWIRAMSPFAPHTAEEIGEGKFATLVAEARFPEPDEFGWSVESLADEAMIDRVEEDLRSVL